MAPSLPWAFRGAGRCLRLRARVLLLLLLLGLGHLVEVLFGAARDSGELSASRI